MGKIIEILEAERKRPTAADFDVVHMYKTGQFYTAYDWSAWIISVISYTDAVRMQTKDRHPLAVTRIKIATSEQTFCKVGFPFKSIEKFCPNRQGFEGVENDHITFRIPFPEPTDGSEITYDRIKDAVEKWTEAHEIKPPKRTQEEMKQIKAQRKAEKVAADAAAATPATTTTHAPAPTNPGGGLIQQILAYPLSDSTPMENYAFIQQLTEQIIMLDPMENCIIVGDDSDWDGMDHAKCMRYVQPGLGLPIGNLTSQLYSNVYLNPFDQFIKRDILCEHYGRYVDDSVMVDACREWLLAQVPKVREFLADELGLQLHMGKLHVREVSQGVEFLGAFVKPYRDYISNKTLARIEENVKTIDMRDIEHAEASINSYLGVLSHSASYNIRHHLFEEIDGDIIKAA